MNEVLAIRSSITELAAKVAQINRDFTSAGIEVGDLMRSFDSLSLERGNVRMLGETAHRCRELAGSMKRVRDELEHRRDSFAAVKLIKQIQADVFSVEVASFAGHVSDWVQNMTSKVVEGAKVELADYFGHIRKSTLKIGQVPH